MQTAGTVENVTLAKPHFCTDYEKARGGVREERSRGEFSRNRVRSSHSVTAPFGGREGCKPKL